MRRVVGSAAVLACALTAACAATMNVSSHVQSGLDFAQYRTYDWGPADALPTGDARLDQDPFFNDHVLGAVEKQMAARGYERAALGETPDLLLHYHASITSRIAVNRVDRERGYCSADTCEPDFREFEAGTLVLDVVDNATNKVIWRGWAQDSLEGVLDHPDRMERQIEQGVSRMMARFPDRGSHETRARAGER